VATAACAAMGDLDGHHTSADPGRTSATATLTSTGAWFTKAKSNSPCTFASGDGRNGGAADRSRLKTSSSESPASGPGFQVTSRASRAFSAWSKVSAITATPAGIRATARTPGMPRAAVSSTAATVPRIVGGRAITVGLAPGTSRSSVNACFPVTMSRAAIPVVGTPITPNAAGSFGAGSTAGTTTSAASADSDP
jgi:hypothetical protein